MSAKGMFFSVAGASLVVRLSDGAKTWLPTVAVTTVPSDESRKPANVANGYGDYEGVAATGDGALATWTDGRQLKRLGEEIYSARLGAALDALHVLPQDQCGVVSAEAEAVAERDVDP